VVAEGDVNGILFTSNAQAAVGDFDPILQAGEGLLRLAGS